MKSASGEVIIDFSDADCKNSISGNHPNINREDGHLHHDPADSGLRPRKKVAAKTEQIEEDTGQLKTKSSIVEPAIPSNIQTENVNKLSATVSSSEILEIPKAASPPVTLAGEANDDDDENGHSPTRKDDENGHSPTRKRPMKINISFLVAVCFSIYMIFILIVSAAMNKLEHKYSNLEIWKWCCLGLLLSLSLPLSDGLIFICCSLIKKVSSRVNKIISDEFKVINNFFFILLKSSRFILCLSLILVIWPYLIGPRKRRLKDATKVLRYIYKVIESAAPVAFAWMLRTIAIKFLYASFYIKRFSKRNQENRFNQNILQILSEPPSGELSKIHCSRIVSCSRSNVIDVQTPRAMIIRWMIEAKPPTNFYTLPNILDESKDLMYPDEQNSRIITAEREAKVVGDHIFRNVAKPEHKYIEEDDLLRFMNKDDVDMVLPSIGGKDESGKIYEKSFHNWVVSMYMKNKSLEYSLNDINEAMKTLLKFVDVLLIVVLIILWLILMRIATREVLLFISSQFLLAVFTFGNSAKSTFEAMIFVFLKHPFDVGDRCVIDGVQVVVEEVSILTTIFLKYDDEKIYYPNSILATKSISNLNRSPKMRDSVEFDLDVSTSVDNISALKDKIKTYIYSKPHLWRAKHSVWVREVADVNKVIKMSLYVTHTLNFLDYEEKRDRRSNLVLELTNIFHQLGIKGYHILPSTSSA